MMIVAWFMVQLKGSGDCTETMLVLIAVLPTRVHERRTDVTLGTS